MKTKTHNRLAAVFLALAMLLTSISFSMFASAEEAAGTGSIVLDADDIAKADYSGKPDTEINGFTIKWGDKGKVDDSGTKFTDGIVGKPDGSVKVNRINFGGKTDLTKKTRVIEFTTTGAADVTIWWVAGDADRFVQIYNVDDLSKPVDAADDAHAKNDPMVSELKVEEAGTYWITSTQGTNYVFRVEVTPQATEKISELNADDIAKADYSGKPDTEINGFTIKWGDKGKVDDSSPKFTDGVVGKPDGSVKVNRINFGGKTDLTKKTRVIEFTTTGAATFTIWWVAGDADRFVQIYNVDDLSKPVDAASDAHAKNDSLVSELKVTEAGTYWITSTQGTNYIFKVSVKEGGAPEVIVRTPWSEIAKPAITGVEQVGGNIKVTVSADVSKTAADSVSVQMYDKSGKEVGSPASSSAKKAEHELTFTPSASGTYSFKATLSRKSDEDGDYEDKFSEEVMSLDYVLPLSAPVISSATSKGGTGNNGTMELVWTPVDEATGYTVYSDGEAVTTVTGHDNTTYIVTGLKVGADHTFNVAAVRGSETGSKSADVTAKATEDEKRTWGYTIYGTSTNAKDGSNGYEGGVNSTGKVTVFSEGGKGKLESGAVDGIMFYYTAVPSDQNFVLRANMHVDKWTYSNGQEAMGLLASDSIPEVMSTAPYWTNNYYLTLGTVAYNWSNGEVVYDGTGTRYDMRLGLGVYPNLGVTKENQKNIVELGLAGTVDPNIQYPLDLTAAYQNLPATTTSLRYNIAANMTNATANSVPETIADIADFDVEIRKNNTGYFFTYYDKDGNVIRTQKFYDTEALSHVDEDNVYVGFFAARNARATFSNINLTLINPEDDDPAEERPITYVTPRLTITSAPVSNSSDYELTMLSNVEGKAVIYLDGKAVSNGKVVRAEELFSMNINISEGYNKISVIFTPYSDQDLGEYTELDPEVKEVKASIEVNYNTDYANKKNLYVSPSGSS